MVSEVKQFEGANGLKTLVLIRVQSNCPPQMPLAAISRWAWSLGLTVLYRRCLFESGYRCGSTVTYCATCLVSHVLDEPSSYDPDFIMAKCAETPSLDPRPSVRFYSGVKGHCI